MMRDITDVLDRNGITYYGVFGTAIGAIRHHGFIPWDDDIDLAVFEEDSPRVNEVLDRELDRERYYFHIPSADTHCHVMSRGTDFIGSANRRETPFIDIFVLNRYPSSKIRGIMVEPLIYGFVHMMAIINRVKWTWLHRLLCPIPRYFKRLALFITEPDTPNTVIYSEGFRKNKFPKASYGTPKLYEFEGMQLPLAEKVDEILTAQYGDYMTPPPEDKRSGAGGFPASVVKDYIKDKKKS